jgi:hypothetical protein
VAVTSILSQLTLLSSPPTQKSKKKRASGNFPTSPHWSAGDAEEESGSGSIWDNNGDLEDEDGSTGGGGGGGGGILGSNMHSRKYEERGEEHDILNEICLMDGSGNGASSSSSGSGSGNKGSPHPHPYPHPHGTKNNGYSLNGGAKNDIDLNTPSHNASSSPNKVGGSSAGNVICVTEICCDEIEVNEKVTKVANELNNLSFLADCVSEIPASGSI